MISGGDDRLPTGTSVTLGSNSGNTSGVLQLGDSSGSCNQTLASLGTSGVGSANAVVGGNASTSTLTINGSNDSIYSGCLGGASGNQKDPALAKNGTAKLTLSGANNFVGGTTIKSGTIVWNNSSALGSGTVTLNDTSTGGNATSLLGSGSATLSLPIVVTSQALVPPRLADQAEPFTRAALPSVRA